jgi:hypothetical protein
MRLRLVLNTVPAGMASGLWLALLIPAWACTALTLGLLIAAGVARLV